MHSEIRWIVMADLEFNLSHTRIKQRVNLAQHAAHDDGDAYSWHVIHTTGDAPYLARI